MLSDVAVILSFLCFRLPLHDPYTGGAKKLVIVQICDKDLFLAMLGQQNRGGGVSRYIPKESSETSHYLKRKTFRAGGSSIIIRDC